MSNRIYKFGLTVHHNWVLLGTDKVSRETYVKYRDMLSSTDEAMTDLAMIQIEKLWEDNKILYDKI